MVIGGRPVADVERELNTIRNPYYPRTAEEARDLVTWLALRDVGLGDPAPYWKECKVAKPYPPAWCGAFALAMLHRAGLCDWSWLIGIGFLYRLSTTSDPQPGDICYFEKHQHHAVYVGDDVKRIVNGNGAGRLVTVTRIGLGHHPTAYYSIGKLLEKYSQPEEEAQT